MIKENMKCINYLEELIDFNDLINEKSTKLQIIILQNSLTIILKIYSFIIKYRFFLHISFYDNLFMKKIFIFIT